jgi:hypothetical protein
MISQNVIALPREPLPVPVVELLGAYDPDGSTLPERLADIRIDWRFGRERHVPAAPSPEMLSAVVGLATIPDDRIAASVLKLASEFGPLSSAICVLDGRDPEGGPRHLHDPVAPPDSDTGTRFRLTCRPRAASFGPLEWAAAGWEPVMLWRLRAVRLAAILGVADALGDGRLGERAKWAVVTDASVDPRRRSARDGKRHPTTPFPQSVEQGRQVVQAAVRDLFDAAAVRLVLGSEAAPAVSLTGDGLGAALAVQTALRISGAEGVAICAECRAVVPDRTPDSRRAFCDVHRTRQVKNKWAARDYRREHPKPEKGASR